jgi:hypothetical protein
VSAGREAVTSLVEKAGARLAEAGATEGTQALAPTLRVGAKSFTYSDRVIARAAEDPGPFHNFPSSFDRQIISHGSRDEFGGGYAQYSERGWANDYPGTYEIGTLPQALVVRNPGYDNIINSISPGHSYYQQAVDWGESWLNRKGF